MRRLVINIPAVLPLLLIWLGAGWASPASACPALLAWPELSAWCGWVQEAMDARDEAEPLKRHIRLFGERGEIDRVRAVTVADADEVCRPVPPGGGAGALAEIAGHLGLGRGQPVSRAAALAAAAGEELRQRAAGRAYELCESVALVEAPGAPPHYFQSYFLRLGSARLGRNVLLSIDSTW